MQKSLLFILFLISSSLTTAQTSGGINLETVMKQMRFEYKQALKTQSSEKFSEHIENFKQQLSTAREFPFSDMRRTKAREGLAKVSQLIESLPVVQDAASLQQSKDALAKLEQLQEQYHDKKPKTFWQKMFGD